MNSRCITNHKSTNVIVPRFHGKQLKGILNGIVIGKCRRIIIKAYVVMRTESATLPLDMYVATFDAWPPGQQETKISPVARGADNFSVCITLFIG